jgi:preprotein translocase SecE subunit
LTLVKKLKLLLGKELNIPLPAKIASGKLGKSHKIRLPRYFRESMQEMKKVTWPSRKESWKLTFAVIVFTGLLMLFIVAVDSLFKVVAERVFLK